MAKKRNGQIDDVVGRVVDIGVDAVIGRIDGLFQNFQNGQAASARASLDAVPPEARRTSYKCTVCKADFAFADMARLEMVGVNPKAPGWGTCSPCYKFIWEAGSEKKALLLTGLEGSFRALLSQATETMKARAKVNPPPAANPPVEPPWEVLGVEQDASIEEVTKAYRNQVKLWHPDKFASGPEKARDANAAHARKRFDQVQHAYESMMKVRKAPT